VAQQAQAGLAAAQRDQPRRRVVGAAVVDEDDLRQFDAVGDAADLRQQRRDILCLVIDRDDDRQGEAAAGHRGSRRISRARRSG
jgi:hypothetical protein